MKIKRIIIAVLVVLAPVSFASTTTETAVNNGMECMAAQSASD